MTTTEPITDEDFRAAMDRLARTEDGRLLYLFLQRRLMTTPATVKSGPLRVDLGQRMFAAQLMGLMTRGIQDSAGRTGSADGHGGGDKPIVFAVTGPSRVGGSGGAGRRIGADTRIPGWDRDD